MTRRLILCVGIPAIIGFVTGLQVLVVQRQRQPVRRLRLQQRRLRLQLVQAQQLVPVQQRHYDEF